ncbi:MAG TPA: hypothetical protein VMJ34_00745, partial [Bryobacteraceae bacterium]|nr:hypothetical protein [Bryobacteraceae bacterium]
MNNEGHDLRNSSPSPAIGAQRRAPYRAFAQALGVTAMVGCAAVALTSFLSPRLARSDDEKAPGVHLPPKNSHTDHSGMMKGPFADGPSVTRACLTCHPAAGQQMLHSEHFTWLGDA